MLMPGKYKLNAVHRNFESLSSINVLVEEFAETKVEIWLSVLHSRENQVREKSIVKEKDGKRKSQRESYYYSTTRKAGSRKKRESTEDNKDTSKPPPPPPLNLSENSFSEAVVLPPKRLSLPQHSGLKAGYADDNKQFNYFLNFLNKFKNEVDYYPIKIKERICLKIFDRDNKPVPNAEVNIKVSGSRIENGKTYADGSYFIYPLELLSGAKKLKASVIYEDNIKEVIVERNGQREIDISFNIPRKTFKSIPLDLLFVLDATGSMAEEIERLKTSIEVINLNLASLNIKPKIRYGMVVYRDKEDDFVTKVIQFTSNLDSFQNELNKISAGGGGDDPEDLQSALKDALQKMKWNENGLRLAFIITDAAPHLNYKQKYTYVKAARDARKKAIKIFTIGTGGLGISGEYILRQISQYTYGKYIFLTYGEKGESDGGKTGSVSHHTGSNYQTENLEAIIIRFAKEELAHLTDTKITVNESFYQAIRVDDEEKEKTLQKLFSRAINDLEDYSDIAIDRGTKVSVIPILCERQSLSNNAEYFTERLNFAMARQKTFELVERKNFQFLAKEVGFQMTGLVEVNDANKLGAFTGAEMLIIGHLFFKENNYEVYLKLIRVETAEILSVTKLKIDYRLGL